MSKRNTFEFFDINFLSVYAGRFLTGALAIIVLILAVTSRMGDGAHRDPLTLAVCDSSVSLEAYEPLRYLIARETRLSVGLSFCDDRQDADLMLLHLDDLTDPDVTVLWGLSPSPYPDHYVFIGRAGERGAETPIVVPGNLPLEFHTRANLSTDDLMTPKVGNGPAAVVFAVMGGEAPVGIVRHSDLDALVAEGIFPREAIEVRKSLPAKPDWVLTCRKREAEHYRRTLRDLPQWFSSSPETAGDAVARSGLAAVGFRGAFPVDRVEY